MYCNWNCRKSDEKVKIAKTNGCDYVINYSKENFAEKVNEINKWCWLCQLFMMVLEKVTFDQSSSNV